MACSRQDKTVSSRPRRRCDQAITQRRSIAKSVGCFQWRLFVCQHDNFRTSKHRTMKLGGRVHYTKISAEFEFRGHSLARLGAHPPKKNVALGYDVGKISAGCLVIIISISKIIVFILTHHVMMLVFVMLRFGLRLVAWGASCWLPPIWRQHL